MKKQAQTKKAQIEEILKARSLHNPEDILPDKESPSAKYFTDLGPQLPPAESKSNNPLSVDFNVSPTGDISFNLFYKG